MAVWTWREGDDGVRATLRFLSKVDFVPFFQSSFKRSKEGFKLHRIISYHTLLFSSDFWFLCAIEKINQSINQWNPKLTNKSFVFVGEGGVNNFRVALEDGRTCDWSTNRCILCVVCAPSAMVWRYLALPGWDNKHVSAPFSKVPRLYCAHKNRKSIWE